MRLAVMALCAALAVGAASGTARGRESWPRAARLGAAADSAGGTSRPDARTWRSPGTAARLSLLATMAPLFLGLPATKNEGGAAVVGGALALTGVVLGPAAGYYYGGCDRRGATGIVVRAGLSALGAIAATQAEWPTLDLWGTGGDSGNAAAFLTVSAFALVFSHMIYDLAQVSHTVRLENERRGRQPPSATPVLSAPFGSPAPAVGLCVRF